ncbi:MAG TPA: hypothetical protein VKY74_24775 [Chloroflexia bacterium]|nr:hypothetical protein [Chloroflexia bacterium]
MLLLAALTDPGRAAALLQGSLTAYEGFDLTASEIANLQTIRAATLADFAVAAHQLFYGEDLRQEMERPASPTPPGSWERASA